MTPESTKEHGSQLRLAGLRRLPGRRALGAVAATSRGSEAPVFVAAPTSRRIKQVLRIARVPAIDCLSPPASLRLGGLLKTMASDISGTSASSCGLYRNSSSGGSYARPASVCIGLVAAGRLLVTDWGT